MSLEKLDPTTPEGVENLALLSLIPDVAPIVVPVIIVGTAIKGIKRLFS